MPDKTLDLKITYNNLFICTVKDVQIVKELPDKDIFLIKTSDNTTKWLKKWARYNRI